MLLCGTFVNINPFSLFLFLSSLALKIHITAEMNDELASIGGFKTEHRGLIDVKVSLKTSNEEILEFKEFEKKKIWRK